MYYNKVDNMLAANRLKALRNSPINKSSPQEFITFTP